MNADRCAALPELIKSAESQYHLLLTGRMARVVVDSNGERVEFTAPNAGRLHLYILGLKQELAACPGQNCGFARPAGPLNFIF